MKKLKALWIIVIVLSCTGFLQAQTIIIDTIVRPHPVDFGGSTMNLDIAFTNNTASAISTIDFYVSINGGTPTVSNWNGNINPSQMDTTTLISSFLVPNGNYSICIYTNMANSDTVCYQYAGTYYAAIPYTSDFENSSYLWFVPHSLPDTIQQWDLGTPNYGSINSAHSGDSSWIVGLNSGYVNSMNTYLYSPIFDFTGLTNGQLSFWQNRNTEQFWDGVRLEYSSDTLQSWHVLGFATDPLGYNWYNDGMLNSSGLPAWDGTSNGWIKSAYHLTQFNSNGLMQFRFVFTSDASVNLDGFAIDDFTLQPCNLNLSFATTNATCFGGNDGVLTATVVGGTSPYIYQWSNGDSVATATGLTAGNYSVTVIDSVGCVITGTATINQGTAITVTQTSSIPAACGNNNGSACVSASGGYGPPYAYDWGMGPGASNCSNNNLAAGVYMITVVDSMGCIGQGTVIVNNVSGPVINIPSFVAVCAGTNLCANVTGGSAPYTYMWSIPGGFISTAPCINPITGGNYILTVTDFNNCSTISAFTVYMDSLQVGVVINSCPSAIAACDGSFTFAPIGGIPPYTYQINGVPTLVTTFPNVCDGSPYDILIVDVNGCSAFKNVTLTPNCDDVWPGDANHDQVADNLDLLAIGIGYGITGPVRSGATPNWVGQPASDWTNSLANNANYKHIDCNGDGAIDAGDTSAIILNYGSTHPYRLAQPQVQQPGAPELYFNIVIDTAGTGQTFDLSLDFGTAANPANNVYGIAFTVNYDKTLVKADSLNIDFSNSWLGTFGTNLIAISHNDTANGQFHVGISRTDHNNISGYGELARITVVTTDNVSGRLLSPVFDTLYFSYSDVTVIDNAENEINYSVNSDSLIVEDLTGLNDSFTADQLEIYPNPAKDKLTVKVPGNYSINKVSLKSITGQLMKCDIRQKNNSTEIRDLKQFSDGIYFLEISTDRGTVIKKVGIVH